MADKIVIEIDLNQGDVKGATKALEKSGEKAGQNAAVKFSNAFDKGISASISGIAKSAAKATALVGSLASAFIGFKSINAAQVQEDAINSLNSALLLSKNASVEASQGIQQFASALQQSTRFGDEVILQNAALIQSLGDLDSNGLKRATQAAADLATVLRVDLGTAATLVGKAAAGEVGSFSRYGLAIQKGANNAETFANALTAIEAKFGGAAQRDVLTYSGSVDQLSNAFGDLLEEFGKIITQNPSVVAAIKSTTNLIVSASGQVAQFAKSFNIFDLIAKSLVSFNDAVITYIVSPLELAINIGNVFFSAINSAAATSIAIIGQLGGVIGNLLSKFGIMNQLSQGLQDFAETSKQTALEVNAGLTSAINNIGSFPLADNLSQRNEELRQFFTEQQEIALQANATTSAINQNMALQSQATAMGIRDVYSSVLDGLTMGFGNFIDKMDEMNKKIKDFSVQSGKQLQQGFAQAAGNAFSAFGAALVKGESALEAFGKMFLKSIGEQAVQLGTKFILEGTGYLFSPGGQAIGGKLIASGAALAAFGGALGAVSGGGGATSGGVAGGNGVTTAPTDTTEVLAAPEAARQAEERTVLNLNIEGSMIRESEASSWITNLLEESGKTNSNLIPSLKTGIA